MGFAAVASPTVDTAFWSSTSIPAAGPSGAGMQDTFYWPSRSTGGARDPEVAGADLDTIPDSSAESGYVPRRSPDGFRHVPDWCNALPADPRERR